MRWAFHKRPSMLSKGIHMKITNEALFAALPWKEQKWKGFLLATLAPDSQAVSFWCNKKSPPNQIRESENPTDGHDRHGIEQYQQFSVSYRVAEAKVPAAQPQLHNKLQSQQRRYIICV